LKNSNQFWELHIFLGSISSTFLPNFFAQTGWEAFFGKWRLVNIELIWQISPHILGKFLWRTLRQNVGTIEQRLFSKCQFHQHFTPAFCTNILAPKITKLFFGFEIFWRQNICKNSARKMLTKLTLGGQSLVKSTPDQCFVTYWWINYFALASCNYGSFVNNLEQCFSTFFDSRYFSGPDNIVTKFWSTVDEWFSIGVKLQGRHRFLNLTYIH